MRKVIFWTMRSDLQRTVKKKTPFWRMLYTCLGRETKTGLVRILVIFQDRLMFSHIIRKALVLAFH